MAASSPAWWELNTYEYKGYRVNIMPGSTRAGWSIRIIGIPGPEGLHIQGLSRTTADARRLVWNTLQTLPEVTH